MKLDALKRANRVIGIKQVTKAVKRSQAERVFLAADADPRVLEPLKELCHEQDVPVEEGASMKEIGEACAIEVGAAAAAVLRSSIC